MRAGRIEEPNALAQRIGKAIANSNRARLSHVNTKTHAKDMWVAVRQLTGRRQNCYPVEGTTADSMNQYYAGISCDADYDTALPTASLQLIAGVWNCHRMASF